MTDVTFWAIIQCHLLCSVDKLPSKKLAITDLAEVEQENFTRLARALSFAKSGVFFVYLGVDISGPEFLDLLLQVTNERLKQDELRPLRLEPFHPDLRTQTAKREEMLAAACRVWIETNLQQRQDFTSAQAILQADQKLFVFNMLGLVPEDIVTHLAVSNGLRSTITSSPYGPVVYLLPASADWDALAALQPEGYSDLRTCVRLRFHFGQQHGV